MTSIESFSGKRAAEIVGITYRQLDYWARTDLVRPCVKVVTGSGSRRSYSYSDLLKLKVIKTLLDVGLRLETVRKVFAYIDDELGEDVESANLVVHGTTPVIVRTGEELMDLVQNAQGILNVLPLAPIRDELDAKIHRQAVSELLSVRPDGQSQDSARSAILEAAAEKLRLRDEERAS